MANHAAAVSLLRPTATDIHRSRVSYPRARCLRGVQSGGSDAWCINGDRPLWKSKRMAMHAGSAMTKMTSCPACGAMISTNAGTCPRCGAISNRTLVAPIGLAIMLAIAVLYVLLQRYL
jgi:hypothetical protein